MHRRLNRLILTACLLLAILPAGAGGNPDVLCANLLESPEGCPLNRAFASLWLNRDLEEANARLEAAWDDALAGATGLTPALADEKFKWQMRTWVRLYYLFGAPAARFPGRLSPENTARIESLLWNYACAKSTLARADLKYVWFIQGSENHDMMDLGNAFLAAQTLAEHPEYAERTLPDGGSIKEHVDAWTAYFTKYCDERIKHGLLIEFASPTYGKYYIPELVNIHDFAGDAALRQRAADYLHLIWADWAIEQLGGVRGGAKARCYQGDYSRKGESDSWFAMGQVLLGAGDWAEAKRYNHPILGYGLALATSMYELPEVIADLATSPEGRGEYVYQSRRPARMAHVEPLPPYDNQSCWYHMAGEDSRFIRYSWCTPDHIMGSYSLDPALREDFQIYPDETERAGARYAAISTQNLWQGIIFNTGPDARIFPQCFAKPDKNKPEYSVTYTQQVAVQHENVMLVQANRANPAIGAFRIYFGPGMKARLTEHDGWRVLVEGESYAAVRFLSRDGAGQTAGATWEDEHFLRADDTYAPAVFVTGRRARFADVDAFTGYLDEHTLEFSDASLSYRFEDSAGAPVSLAVYLDIARLPEKNEKPLDLAPEPNFQNPFIDTAGESGAYIIRFGGREVTINGSP